MVESRSQDAPDETPRQGVPHVLRFLSPAPGLNGGHVTATWLRCRAHHMLDPLIIIIHHDLPELVKDLTTHFEGQIAVITGITINAEIGNYFSGSKVEVYGKS